MNTNHFFYNLFSNRKSYYTACSYSAVTLLFIGFLSFFSFSNTEPIAVAFFENTNPIFQKKSITVSTIACFYAEKLWYDAPELEEENEEDDTVKHYANTAFPAATHSPFYTFTDIAQTRFCCFSQYLFWQKIPFYIFGCQFKTHLF